METAALERIDSFPYRHHAAELMSAPAVSMPADTSVSEAARTMIERRISSVLVLDDRGHIRGILTERDVLRLVADQPAGLAARIAEAMTTPVHGIEADALVYRALARMARLGVNHLPVHDGEGRPLGMLTAGTLLKRRASLGATLGDEIDDASDAAALKAAHDKLPALAAALRREEVSAVRVSAVVAGVVRDLTARAGELALAAMAAGNHGEPPAPWCLLVLGSAGRGESLLVPDQDNALVHDGGDAAEPWFAAFAERLNTLLDDAGVPFCKGGVMARNPAFRHPLPRWREQIDAWIDRPQPQALLNVDIFYDFVPVLGDRALARALRAHTVQAAARSPLFLRLLAQTSQDAVSALDLLGRLRTENGRADLKRRGLFPIVAGARAIALGWNSAATATDARLAEAAVKGAFPAEAASELAAARAVIVEAILDQQLADIDAGLAPSSRVDPKRLTRAAARRLREALAAAATTPELVREALANRSPVHPA